METTISISFDKDALQNYTDGHLAALWHVAQANPAPIEDHDAGEIAESIGREIIRRFLARTSPELWRHQGRHYYWNELRNVGRWEPSGPEGKDHRFVSYAEAAVRALKVISDTPAIRGWLEDNDPKALEHVRAAIVVVEGRQ